MNFTNNFTSIHVGDLTLRIKDDNGRTVEMNDDVLEQYEPMVWSLVLKAGKSATCTRDDLYQEGMMAVFEAYMSYDPNSDATLETWIYRRIQIALWEYQKKNMRFLSGGEYLYVMERKAGKNASVDDYQKLGVSKKTAMAVSYYNKPYETYDAAAHLLDPDSQQMLENNSAFQLDYAKYLNETECFIVEHYYGLNGQKVMTMGEIGEKLGKSRKAISYALNIALCKLRKVDGIEDFVYA